MAPVIRCDAVCVAVGGHQVLHDLSASFGPGVTAFVGRNGAGKTTLIRTLCGLLTPRSGTVTVNGAAPYKSAASTRLFRSDLGWMPQDPPLPGRARVVDVVRYAAWLRGVDREVPAAVSDALASSDVTELATRRVSTLSGGQQRRVALAAALVGRPAVMLLDEPTVGLDPEQRDHFLTAVRESAAERTVIVSTHLMEDVLGVADRIVVITGGRVTRSSSLEEVLAHVRGAGPGEMMTALRRIVLARDATDTDTATR